MRGQFLGSLWTVHTERNYALMSQDEIGIQLAFSISVCVWVLSTRASQFSRLHYVVQLPLFFGHFSFFYGSAPEGAPADEAGACSYTLLR